MMTGPSEESLRASPSALPDPPATIRGDDGWHLGRYRDAIPTPEFGVNAIRRMRLKEWHYQSFVTDEWFLALGVVQLGYLATAFAYLVDREKPTLPPREFSASSPFGRALSFAPSSVEGRTTWRRRKDRISAEWMEPEWRVKLDVPFADARLHGELRTAKRESLALVHALDDKRIAYTQKSAGLPTTGVLDLGDLRLDFRKALGVVDWTRSLADRETRWKWASFAWLDPEGRTLGLNLSAEVYDDENGDSRENALFVDGSVIPLRGVAFTVPQEPGVHDWRITSRDGSGEVDLTFEPFGARKESRDLRLVQSEFIQPFGVFRGTVQAIVVDGAFGVVEDHVAIW